MSKFKDFQNEIKEINNVWNSENVFFTQMRDGYSASYRPKYPGYCNEDMIIQTLEGTGAANRGNYELIIFAGGKFTSKYFNYVDEIKAYFKDRQKNGSIWENRVLNRGDGLAIPYLLDYIF